MSFDREDFEQAKKKRADEHDRSRLPLLRSLSAAAPKMETLTQDERWDQYLAYLMGMREKLTAAKAHAHARLDDPRLTDHDEIMRFKIAIHINDAMIQTIDLAAELPKAIIEGGRAATDRVAEFERQSSIDR